MNLKQMPTKEKLNRMHEKAWHNYFVMMMGKASTHFDMITYQKELRRTQHTFLNPVNGIIPHSHVQLSPRQPLYIVSLGEMQ